MALNKTSVKIKTMAQSPHLYPSRVAKQTFLTLSLDRWMHGWVGGWVDELMNEWVDGWMGGWMGGWT